MYTNGVDLSSSNSKLKRILRKFGIKEIDPERKELCIAGLDLCVLSESDIIYIVLEAKDFFSAQRRLHTRISES